MEKTLAFRYQIVRQLGGGGFGETFLAEDAHLPGTPLCVVKKLKPTAGDKATLEVAKRLFDREAETLYCLGNHDRIPRLLAHFEENEDFYLVEEFIEGQPLDRELADRKHLSESDLIALLRDILEVLAFVHEQNVIHRDIKPANLIRRRRDGKIVLIDFGAVKAVSNQAASGDGETNLTVAIGSPGYMPGEQLAGNPHFSSDIYAVGMLCLQALTGVSPKKLRLNYSTGEICCDLFKNTAPVSLGLAAIIDKMVRSHYRERYENATEALQALEQLIHQYEEVTFFTPIQPDFSASWEETQLPPSAIAASVETTVEAIAREGSKTAGQVLSQPTDAPIPVGRQEYRDRQIFLNKVKNAWIKGVLEKSLHGQALIVLGLEERLNAVETPAALVWETPNQPRQTLPPGTRVIDQFDRLGIGRSLLILGEPGSGKTITLLELARDLIARAERDVSLPMPVMLNLSSWKGGKQAIADWLVFELNSQYQVSKSIGRGWVKEEKLLLLLDGLDEVKGDRRDECVQAINQFRQEYGGTEIVACSRIADYEALPHRLRLGAAIYLQPLAWEQIQHYLARAGEKLAAVSRALQTDAQLQELARSPLMLNIITLAYQGMSVEELPSMNLEQRRQHLFDAYIERMFSRRGDRMRYPKQKAMHWLIWLAQRMVQESQTVFLIERMQPDWLPTLFHKALYILGLVAIFWIVTVGVFHRFLPIYRLIISMFIGLFICVLIFGFNIKTVETLNWSGKRLCQNLAIWPAVGAFGGIVAKGIYEIVYAIVTNPLYWSLFEPIDIQLPSYLLIRGLVFGLSIGLVFGAIRGLTGPGIETRTVPNQGILSSARNSVILASIGIIVPALAAYLVRWSPVFWGSFGLLFGLAAGGAEACLKHFSLRAVLYFSGKIPWNYARFLDYATERILLQKVGGGYIFIHRLLLEHFAAMTAEQK